MSLYEVLLHQIPCLMETKKLCKQSVAGQDHARSLTLQPSGIAIVLQRFAFPESVLEQHRIVELTILPLDREELATTLPHQRGRCMLATHGAGLDETFGGII